MNLLETLIHPDREEHPERAEVARAANLLQIGEFQLLQLAYHDRFGVDVPPGQIDRLFGAYMLQNRAPLWAREYARRIIGLDTAGMLDERDPTYHRYDPHCRRVDPEGARRFCTVAALVAVFLGGGLWLGREQVEPTSQIFPPYVSDREIGPGARGPDS